MVDAPTTTKKLYPHICTNKTGTTALQVLLSENDQWLQGAGFLFPKTGRIASFSGQHNIDWELNGDPRFDANMAALLSYVQKSKNQLVTNAKDYLTKLP